MKFGSFLTNFMPAITCQTPAYKSSTFHLKSLQVGRHASYCCGGKEGKNAGGGERGRVALVALARTGPLAGDVAGVVVAIAATDLVGVVLVAALTNHALSRLVLVGVALVNVLEKLPAHDGFLFH